MEAQINLTGYFNLVMDGFLGISRHCVSGYHAKGQCDSPAEAEDVVE